MRPRYVCPHCDKPGISMLRRACLGPALAAQCANCGQKVGVPWGSSSLAACPLVVACLVSQFAPTWAVSVVVMGLGLGLTAVANFKFVPLIKA